MVASSTHTHGILSAPVVYCYDGSEPSRHALRTASKILGEKPSMVLTVWHSAWVAIAAAPYAMLSPETMERVDTDSAAAANAMAAEGAALIAGATPHIEQTTGPVWECVLEFAHRHGAELIVAGSRGLTPIKSTVLGSVSHGLVNHSHTPVMVIPPAPH
jgi:nucleotide-binding universal stress UspA family protein